MATIAIQIGIAVGVAAVNYLLTPKPKLDAVDRGKLDDIRVTTAEEGAFLPRCYGRRVRLGGLIAWASPTLEHVTTTPGRTGGKGGGGSGTAPPERHYTYTKSLDIVLCATRSRSLRRIWDGTEVVYDAHAQDSGPGYYEAEEGLLLGGFIEECEDCSGERHVRLRTDDGVEFFVDALARASGPLVLYYTAPDGGQVRVMSGGGTTLVVTLPAASVPTALVTAFPDLPDGGDTVTITNIGTLTVYLDRIFYRLGLPDIDPEIIPPVSGVLSSGAYPSDPNNPSERYNAPAFADGRGVTEAQIQTANTNFIYRFYSGLETQLADALEVAATGDTQTPAYRGVTRIVFEDYELREGGRFDNFTFEIEPEIRDLAEMVRDLWSVGGGALSALDVTALEGETVPGWIVNQPDLAEQLEALQQWFGFDLVPIGGQLVAIRRGGASVATIDESELSAHLYGSERPLGVVEITHPEERDLPGTVLVNYLDPNSDKEFHTGTESYSLDAAGSYDNKSYTFPVVASPDAAQERAKRLLLEARFAKPFEFATGPKYAHLVPSDVITLRRANATDTLRLVSRQSDFAGVTKWKAVRERASLYQQIGAGQTGTGTEFPPVVRFPANTELLLLDVGPLRSVDDVLGYYVAVVPRGYGDWRGARLYKQESNGEWAEVTTFDRFAMLGHVVTPLSDFDGTGWDRDSTLVIDFFKDTGEIESRPESEILALPINVLAVNTGDGVEIVQYATAVASGTTFPYVVRYTFSNFLRGRLNTEAATGGHTAGQLAVSLSDAVKFRTEELRELNSTRAYKAVSVGQNLGDAANVNFSFFGWNQRPAAPVLDGVAKDGSGNVYLAWHHRSRHPSFLSGADVTPGTDAYELELITGGTVVRTLQVQAGEADRWLPIYYYNDNGSGGLVIGGYDCGQRLDVTDTVLEAEFLNTDSTPYTPELQLFGLGASGRERLRAGLSPSTGLYVYAVSDSGVSTLVYQQNEVPTVTARVRFEVRNERVSVYYNYTYPEQPPNYISPLTVLAGQSPTARVSYGSNNGATTLGRTTIRTVRADCVLRFSDLLDWFGGSVPSPFVVRLYEMSPTVGRGRVLEFEVV